MRRLAAFAVFGVLLAAVPLSVSAQADCDGDGKAEVGSVTQNKQTGSTLANNQESSGNAADSGLGSAPEVVNCVSGFAERGITQVAPILIGTIAFLALLGFLMLVWRRVRGFVRGMGSKRSA